MYKLGAKLIIHNVLFSKTTCFLAFRLPWVKDLEPTRVPLGWPLLISASAPAIPHTCSCCQASQQLSGRKAWTRKKPQVIFVALGDFLDQSDDQTIKQYFNSVFLNHRDVSQYQDWETMSPNVNIFHVQFKTKRAKGWEPL